MAISGGTAHGVTKDIKDALLKDSKAHAQWESLTPLARNEWICWATYVKKSETRNEHVQRMISELKEGMRRPCCWYGCPHRKDKEVAPSVKGVLARLKRR